MELATGAMSPLLDKLGKLLVSELTLETRVRQDVASLQREMAEMHAALRTVAAVPPDRVDEVTAQWARDVRELFYDMEDAVDAFIVRVDDLARPDSAGGGLRSRLRGFLDRTAWLFSKGKALHWVAGAVRDAQGLAKQLGELRHRYGNLQLHHYSGGGAGVGDGDSIDPRLMAMYGEAADHVGVDEPRDELIKTLSDRSEVGVKTVSIVGFGGLGKTTLAKAVYDKIKLQFDCGAFVSMSRNPDITRMFKKIMYELNKERYANINEAVRDEKQLIDELREFLQNKMYLIVIDDLWDEEQWKIIKCAFPKNSCSSRLITTTRKFNVSEASCSSDGDKIYKMKPLSDDDSQRLFYSRIFRRGNGCPPELEQVSRDILKKCGGVPLAIISIASLLASHTQVSSKDQWCIVLNSIGHGLTDGGNVEDMNKILSLSYYDLPSHLKTCLLYLSIFPEDFDIERDRLIWRWIAEGFIQHLNGRDNLYEVGESYFIELINRSMIQPVAIDPYEGRAEACRVHDIMLDLIRSLSSKENFVTIGDDYEQTAPSKVSIANLQKCPPHSHSNMARRLSLQNSTTSQAITTMSKVRSFTIFNPAIDSLPSLSQFQVLRVLDLEGCDLSKCGSHFKLKHVGKLSQLRYLGLRRTCIRELPMEVGKLKFLLTLDVRESTSIQKLPPTITGLRNLISLRLHWGTKLPRNGLRNLTSLEELTGLSWINYGHAAVVSELGHLTTLRVLTVCWKATKLGEDLVKYLGNLCKMQSLDVCVVRGSRCEPLHDWVPPPGLRRFFCRGPTCMSTLPAWITSSSLPCVTYLDVWVSRVRSKDLHALGMLPALRAVRLYATGHIDDDDHPPTDKWTAAVGAGAFPCARTCAFLHFATAPSMFPRGAMPLVQRLEFSLRVWDVVGGASGFGPDDLCMEHLPSLESVYVELYYREEDGAEVAEQAAAVVQRSAKHHPNLKSIETRCIHV